MFDTALPGPIACSRIMDDFDPEQVPVYTGPPRARRVPTIGLSVRVDIPLIQRIDAFAAEHKIERSVAVRMLLDKALKK